MAIAIFTNLTVKGVSALNFLFAAVADEVRFYSVGEMFEFEACETGIMTLLTYGVLSIFAGWLVTPEEEVCDWNWRLASAAAPAWH